MKARSLLKHYFIAGPPLDSFRSSGHQSSFQQPINLLYLFKLWTILVLLIQGYLVLPIRHGLFHLFHHCFQLNPPSFPGFIFLCILFAFCYLLALGAFSKIPVPYAVKTFRPVLYIDFQIPVLACLFYFY